MSKITFSTFFCLCFCLCGWAQAGQVIEVYVSIPPQKYFVEKIGGQYVKTRVMIEPGEIPETFAPSPRKLAALAQADIYFRMNISLEKIWISSIRDTSENLKIIDCCRDLLAEAAPPTAAPPTAAPPTAAPPTAAPPTAAPPAATPPAAAPPTAAPPAAAPPAATPPAAAPPTAAPPAAAPPAAAPPAAAPPTAAPPAATPPAAAPPAAAPPAAAPPAAAPPAATPPAAAPPAAAPPAAAPPAAAPPTAAPPAADLDDDFHVWTDPNNAIRIANLIKRELINIDPARARTYEDNFREFEKKLEELDRFIRAKLEHRRTSYFLVGHASWGHYAAAYGLKQLAVEEGNGYVGPGALSEIIRMARREKIQTVFVQDQINPSISQSLADEIGADLISLDPLAEDYINNLKDVTFKISRAIQ